MKTEDKYHVSDPFFVVHCKKCGKKYWSTRRINKQCSVCKSTDVVTYAPEHTIDRYKGG